METRTTYEYQWTGGWDCYNKFEVTEGGVRFNPDDAQGGLGFVNTYTERRNLHISLQR